VLDLVMPGTSGWEVLASLRANEKTRDIPVVVLSILAGEGIDESDSPTKIDMPFDNEALFSALKLAVSSDRTQCSVVVVEDDVDLATVLVATFARHGIQALSVNSFAGALDAIPETAPDLVVLDLTLPDGNGADLIERLRNDGHLRGVPVVVYTGQDMAPDEVREIKDVDVRVFTKSRVSIEEFEENVLELLDAMLQSRPARS
jgi:CheY-like chemotaxis protein